MRKLRPIIRSYLIVLTCGSLVRPDFSPGLSADESLDLRGSEAAGLWHTACRGAVKLALGPPRQFATKRWPFKFHNGSLLGGRTNILAVSSAALSISHHLSV